MLLSRRTSTIVILSCLVFPNINFNVCNGFLMPLLELCFIPRYAYITPVLIHLHWLPVKYRIEFKIALLVYKALHGMAPDYIIELLLRKPNSRYKLRSDDQGLLFIPKTRDKTLGDRAFAHSALLIWNMIPYRIRISKTIESFKSQLKTFLFKKAFNPNF